MRRIPRFGVLALAIIVTTPTASKSSEREDGDEDLAKLDLQQKDMVAKADVDGLATLSAPRVTINAPTGRVLTREQFLGMMRSGQLGTKTSSAQSRASP